MSDVSHLYDEFVRAWHAGLVPDVVDVLDRAPEGRERDELADRLDAFLADAPSVQPTPERERQLRADPVFARLRDLMAEPDATAEPGVAAAAAGSGSDAASASDAAAGPDAVSEPGTTGAWRERLRDARRRAGLSVEQLGERFAGAFGLAGAHVRAAELLDGLESGTLAPSRVSVRATERLADLLAVPAASLAPPRPRPLFRAEADDDATAGLAALLSEVTEAFVVASEAPDGPAEGDEAIEIVDRLLGGG